MQIILCTLQHTLVIWYKRVIISELLKNKLQHMSIKVSLSQTCTNLSLVK